MNKVELTKIQDYVYKIFVEFDRVCRKHGIKYSMEGGTLLGAVKYQNFVPWDDDIDVIMLREDYEKFLKVVPQELNGEYFLQSYNNVPSFPLNYAKLLPKGLRGTFNVKTYEYEFLLNHPRYVIEDLIFLKKDKSNNGERSSTR